ncbi:hypothetical protein AVEN_274336-1 [Araneus ventricosus]|uniref:Uncharacterized protein n=1 Tax=Araneus ventricosus TaxID=182803 RepID=A0A4Y2TVM5_ARAVE|nr:hypothetical protein AVEN_274336-1 [Araneus ventricosus]
MVYVQSSVFVPSFENSINSVLGAGCTVCLWRLGLIPFPRLSVWCLTPFQVNPAAVSQVVAHRNCTGDPIRCFASFDVQAFTDIPMERSSHPTNLRGTMMGDKAYFVQGTLKHES